MRIKITKSKNTEHYSIIKDVVKNNKRTTEIYENLGSYDDIKNKCKTEDVELWLKNYVKQLNEKNKKNNLPVIIKKYENVAIDKNINNLSNIGYIFLQKIYHSLGLDTICNKITEKHRFKYDLNSILKILLYSRIIYPSSKKRTYELSQSFYEKPEFDSHNIYRALEIIADENDYIQSALYNNSLKYKKRNNKILFYDCTNYFFEIEQEDDLRKYGKSKENRPLPIVQMGLFLDGNGLPLAFSITPGNTNEQTTLKPIEQKIIDDFNTSKFVVCTDAGLASTANRKFNNKEGRSFITTQSIKKLKNKFKEEAIDLTKGWMLIGTDKKYNISKLKEDERLIEIYKDKIFYKERWIKENDLEQRLIVTFSVKYQEYQKNIRNNQIERAKKLISKNPQKIGKAKQNDFKRFVNTISTTPDGEVAETNNYFLNEDLIKEEEKYDGLYAICTNLEDDVKDIIKINHNRWEIEESFRIMKSDFKSRPVYLSKEDRIKAHFTTCFLALYLYRYLEMELNEEFTTEQIITTIKNMNLVKEKQNYFSPAYTRTDLTDKLHDFIGFRTDYEIISEKNLEKIIQSTKK